MPQALLRLQGFRGLHVVRACTSQRTRLREVLSRQFASAAKYWRIPDRARGKNTIVFPEHGQNAVPRAYWLGFQEHGEYWRSKTTPPQKQKYSQTQKIPQKFGNRFAWQVLWSELSVQASTLDARDSRTIPSTHYEGPKRLFQGFLGGPGILETFDYPQTLNPKLYLTGLASRWHLPLCFQHCRRFKRPQEGVYCRV